jgi:hypothetical protein
MISDAHIKILKYEAVVVYLPRTTTAVYFITFISTSDNEGIEDEDEFEPQVYYYIQRGI